MNNEQGWNEMFGRARAFCKAGLFEKVISLFSSLTEQYSCLPEARNLLSAALILRGCYAECIEMLQKNPELDNASKVNLCVALMRMESFSEALKVSETIDIGFIRNDPTATCARGRALAATGAINQADSCFRECFKGGFGRVERNPYTGVIWNIRFYVSPSMVWEDWNGLNANFEEKPTSGHFTVATLHWNWAMAHLYRKNLKRAASHLRECLNALRKEAKTENVKAFADYRRVEEFLHSLVSAKDKPLSPSSMLKSVVQAGMNKQSLPEKKWRIGDKIAGRYEIYQILGGEGKSGMGIVYICYDHKDQMVYALKTSQERYLLFEETQKLFEREAIIWTELEKYPYIVRAFTLDMLEGRLFIFLEYVNPDAQGRNTLTHYLGNLSYPDILKFSIQFCYGMEYAYSRGIDAHRDIKPDNIMITADKTVKITDFGLAKAFQGLPLKEDIISAGESSGLSIFQTKQGKWVCGTLQYMAPEQFDGHADKRSDIYSFGIVLYQMVANGKLPFIAKTQQEYEELSKSVAPPYISSPLFSAIIQKCLEKNPDKRYQSFSLVREKLQDLLFRETGERITLPQRQELNAREISSKAGSLQTLGKYDEAILCYNKAIQLNPVDFLSWNNKGVILAVLGRDQEAITCFDEVIKINPKFAVVWYDKGNILAKLGRHNEAIELYDKAIGIDSKFAEAWGNKGSLLNSIGRHHEAIICCDRAIEINSRNVVVWTVKGNALIMIGKSHEGIICYDNAIEINPRDAETWYNKGVALCVLDRSDEGLRCVEEAIKLSPDFSKAYQFKQFILQKLGR